MIGSTLAHYRITAALGAGGMGEVWRASDTRLGREVALKVLPNAFAEDSERMARFEREAKVLASLNHPNIAHLYGLETVELSRSEAGAEAAAGAAAPGREGDNSKLETQDSKLDVATFLVMELVEGEGLDEIIARGPIQVDEAIPAALQIAEALEAAHEAGIVHRDLKPANIKIRPDGTVKVLDFGLAKAWETPEGDSSLSLSPTLTRHATVEGVILGTAAYMSPEQARGKPVDKRSDIWAFGVVLWEMLTGQTLFEGETATDVLAAVVRQEIDLGALGAATPPRLRAVIGRCLDRDPRTRLRDIGEARIAIAGPAILLEPGGSTDDATVASTLRARWRTLAALIAAGVVGGGIAGWFLRTAPAPATRRLALAAPVEVEGPRSKPSISPDGTSMAYFADGKLWLQNLDQLTARAVPGSETASQAAWSPDGGALAVAMGSDIRRVTLDGDSTLIAHIPVAIGDLGGSLTWTADDTIVYATGDNSIFEVPVTGGSPRPILDPDSRFESDFHQPFALPEGRGVLYAVHRDPQGIDTLEVLAGGQRRVVFREPDAVISFPVYSPTGHILFERSDAASGLWSLPFSLSRLETTGPAVLITAEGSRPSVARDGTLLYSSIGSESNHRLAVVGLDGVVTSEIGEPVQHADNARLSPDGKLLAVCVEEGSDANLWVYDLERGSKNRIVFKAGCGGRHSDITWTPDSSAVVFGDSVTGTIRMIRADGGSGEASTLVDGWQPELSLDGEHLVYTVDGDLWYRRINGSADPQRLLQTPAREDRPRLSPSGDLMSYVSNATGRSEVYVSRFPSGAGRWQVSADGGDFPVWSRDGNRLYYLKDDLLLMEVEVTTEPSVRMGGARRLFSTTLPRLGPNHGYDVTADGRGLVTVHYAEPRQGSGDLILVTSWK